MESEKLRDGEEAVAGRWETVGVKLLLSMMKGGLIS